MTPTPNRHASSAASAPASVPSSAASVTQAPAAASPIRLVAWNIRAGGGRRVEGIADQLERWGADIAALSEFRASPPSARLTACLAEAGLEYRLTTADPALPNVNRLLLASRWPLRAIRLRQPPDHGRWLLARVGVERPFALGAMHVPNRSTGLKYPYFDAVVDFVKRWRGGPALLVGDTNSGLIGVDEQAPAFNAREDGWVHALGSAGWTDAYRHRHGDIVGYTWYSPNGGNGFRLDEAFINRALLPRLLEIRHAWGVLDGGVESPRHVLSDHAAVLVTLDA